MSYLKRNIKPAFKTVTFHFKEYICFYIAVMIIQILFGIIVMSASSNIKYERKTVSETYNYHISFLNMNKRQYDYLSKMGDSKYDPSDYPNETVPPAQTGNNVIFKFVKEDSRGSGGSKTYDMYFLFEDRDGTSPEKLYKRYQKLYERDLKVLRDEHGDYEVILSPLYNIDDRLASVKATCATWLAVLGGVSIAVFILLYNIRINHFKFTYGIYMSFGADSKKLFGTCFWEVMVISWLTLLPSALIATLTDFAFFKLGGYEYFFSPQLMLWVIIFMIPIILISVYLPVKNTAVKPPLKLLLAEDNSNLASSPRISSGVIGRKFPWSYEKLSLLRFRKYNIQLTLSSVVFAALFVCTSFYCSVYSYSMNVKQPEFTVKFEQNRVEHTQIITSKGEESKRFETLRKTLYKPDVYLSVRNENGKAYAFEKFYDNSLYEYSYTDAPGGTRIRSFTALDGTDATAEYESAKAEALKGDASEENLRQFEEYFDSDKYILEKLGNGVADKAFILKKEEKKIITYEGPTYESWMEKSLYSIGGITDVFKNCSVDAFGISSYAMFQQSDVKRDSSFLTHPRDRRYSEATINVEYRAADSEIINYLENSFECSGDFDDLVNVGSRVIISNSVNNKEALNIKVGDNIKIAKLKSLKKRPTLADGLEGDKYLEFIMKHGEFEYRTYKVCGIIENMSSDGNMVMYFSDEEFKAITNIEPLYKEVSIFVDQSLSDSAVNALSADLRHWAKDHDYTRVEWLNTLSETRSERAMLKLPIFQTIAVMILILSPIFWFFSQIMFYKKREKEFELLRGMGAVESEIRKLFLADGLMLAGLGALVTLLLSSVGVFVMYSLTQKYLTIFVTATAVKYNFEFPLVAVVAATSASAVFGFLSSYLPYGINKKNLKNKASEEFGE